MSAEIEIEDAAALLKAIGHATRLTLLDALVDGERAVGDIESVTGIGQPGLSQQLGVLRKAGLVRTRREAKQIFYRIDTDRIAQMGALIDRLGGAGEADPVATRMRAGGGAAMFARVDR
ncbi:ArsR/SmtB family transcription factor [Stakelama marina]|uniref:Helix-turn-helix transcriptional regulator n=1 Tax=Stakelama marina TaxID=2826939 RepID=A0A8T4I8E8_9SPHN|nr:metalloregulator ArsR/SmtB family transcription factor [Stakelama marina]MBR0551258.1 helix-turn-helix transcriptional regulator [Stakelama marina]